nr:hypothetical protein [Paenibacillus lemnae]
MTISLVFESKNEGTILVGTDKHLDQLTHPEIKELIGEEILIRGLDNQEIPLQVSSIQISTSMADKKNVGICVGKSIAPNDIEVGSIILKS